MVQKIYLVIHEIGFEERIVCSYTSREMAHLHVELLEKYMDDTPRLREPMTVHPPVYSPVWRELVRQREEYIQTCPYDVGLKGEIFDHFDNPPSYIVRETILVRHPDEYLENIAPS